MMIYLDAEQQGQIARHGEATYPHEGCGLLLGQLDPDAIRVAEVLTVDNVREDSRHNRYVIAPEDVLRAEREADAKGLELVGFFHSHPDAAPVPSDYDLEHASWPGFAYVIVSVQQGRATTTRAWQLSPDRTTFEELTWMEPSLSDEGGVRQ